MGKSNFILLMLCISANSSVIHTCSRKPKNKGLSATEHKEVIKNSYNRIPTLQLASVIAESILKEEYGSTTIQSQKPLEIALKKDEWMIDRKKD